jgi:hypothetical protein
LKGISGRLINLHGGYFSILLGGEAGGHCLTGVTHAPEFGEHRSVVPVGGGIPIARYYERRLHERVRYRDAAAIFAQAGWLATARIFHEKVCDCEECLAVLNGDPANFTVFGAGEVKQVRRKTGMVSIEYPYSATRIHCLKHYLQRKHREFQMANHATRDVVLTELENGLKEYRPYVGDGGIAHLVRWLTVLREA